MKRDTSYDNKCDQPYEYRVLQYGGQYRFTRDKIPTCYQISGGNEQDWYKCTKVVRG